MTGGQPGAGLRAQSPSASLHEASSLSVGQAAPGPIKACRRMIGTRAAQVRASSPSCRTTEPHRLCSSQFSRASVAKPQAAPCGRRLTWWLLDLGSRRLACNHYTLRADGSGNYPRSWRLQGCRDAAADCWLDLSVHERDVALQMPGQSRSWPCAAAASSYPVSLLRLVQTESSTPHASQAGAMCLSNFEFYGWLTQTQTEAGPA